MAEYKDIFNWDWIIHLDGPPRINKLMIQIKLISIKYLRSEVYIFSISGLVYGKGTEVLRKSYNKDLEPYLCFSMIMKTRSMDFYLTDK